MVRKANGEPVRCQRIDSDFKYRPNRKEMGVLPGGAVGSSILPSKW